MARERARLLMADAAGNIYDHESLLMLCRKGSEWRLPHESELIALPPESELFLLPGRPALGLDPASGRPIAPGGLAVAAFVAPGHTLSAHPAHAMEEGAPPLPLFAYGAVGFASGRFVVCARKVDADQRQVFSHIPPQRIIREAERLMAMHPRNRLVRHIIENCVRRYACPAARNFALGRFEAPLPSARSCNAGCLGCISQPQEGSPVATTPQCRLDFTPTPLELAEVMRIHEQREKRWPIYSFGQGCEGDPLLNAELLRESITLFRQGGGRGTVNCNSNGSRPEVIADLAAAGLTSLRVSLNSARPERYERYYRPRGYSFAQVRESICEARRAGLFVSLNYLFFPGLSDTEEELAALSELAGQCGVSMIQWRNLNIDPQWYLQSMGEEGPVMGLGHFMKRLKKLCPWLRYGYFNPWLGEKASLEAPLPA